MSDIFSGFEENDEALCSNAGYTGTGSYTFSLFFSFFIKFWLWLDRIAFTNWYLLLDINFSDLFQTHHLDINIIIVTRLQAENYWLLHGLNPL